MSCARADCATCQAARHAAAVQYMQAADNVRVLTQVARARNEPVDRWVTNAQWHAVTSADRLLTAAGLRDVRPTWGRGRGDGTC